MGLQRFRICLTLLTLASLVTTAGAETATGVVFDDRNGDGVRGAAEPGLVGIAVSNGRDVVQTDGAGAWSLPAGEDTLFFVVKPTGRRVPLDSNQLPQFFHRHKPAGSPPLAAPGVAPTGALPASIDFPLTVSPEPDSFEVVYFADPQARGLREMNFVAQDVINELIGSMPAFGVTLGDLVADDAALFKELSEITGQIGAPWYNVFGNHDTNRDAVDARHADETFEHYFGSTYYAFEYGGVCFITLNNIQAKADGYDRVFSADQLAFVAAYLAVVPKERLVVLHMHVPLPGCRNVKELLALLSDRPHTLSLAGHTHEMANLFLGERHGWQGATPHHHLISGTVSGSWWCGLIDEQGIPHATMNDGGPNGYTVMTFSGTTYRARYKAARRPADYQMNLYLPHEVAAAETAGTELLVNVFAGSERSTVSVQWDREGEWLPLTQTRGRDPEVQRMHDLNPFRNQEVFGWNMDEPSLTDHLWKGAMPALAPGAHTCSVRTVDMYGQTWTAHRVFRVR